MCRALISLKSLLLDRISSSQTRDVTDDAKERLKFFSRLHALNLFRNEQEKEITKQSACLDNS